MTSRPDERSLARIAHEVAAGWGVEVGPPFAAARHSLVAPVGQDAVLKVSPHDDDESLEEAEALTLWNGDGAVRLLRHSPVRRAFLIERAIPGDDLSELPDDEATAIAVDVGRRLWRPAGKPFRWIGDEVPRWLERVESPSASQSLVALAHELYDSLDVGRSTLVHGDFHHHNILRAQRGYLAIDPKPMLGEPEYDVAPFLWNPMPYRMRPDITERRLAAFAAIGLDEERMRAWSVIRGAYLVTSEGDAEVLRSLV